MQTNGFLNPRQLNRHYASHGAEFGAKSATQYQALADMFLGGIRVQPIEECVRGKGDIVRFNPVTDEYGVLDSGSTIRTYFKPVSCVETRALNQAVKRNADRFPDDFMFKLTLEEAKAVLALRSQFVTLKRGEHLKYAPYVFTGSERDCNWVKYRLLREIMSWSGCGDKSYAPSGLCIPTPRFCTAYAVGYYLSPFGLGV
jgi:hypothetical protein